MADNLSTCTEISEVEIMGARKEIAMRGGFREQAQIFLDSILEKYNIEKCSLLATTYNNAFRAVMKCFIETATSTNVYDCASYFYEMFKKIEETLKIDIKANVSDSAQVEPRLKLAIFGNISLADAKRLFSKTEGNGDMFKLCSVMWDCDLFKFLCKEAYSLHKYLPADSIFLSKKLFPGSDNELTATKLYSIITIATLRNWDFVMETNYSIDGDYEIAGPATPRVFSIYTSNKLPRNINVSRCFDSTHGKDELRLLEPIADNRIMATCELPALAILLNKAIAEIDEHEKKLISVGRRLNDFERAAREGMSMTQNEVLISLKNRDNGLVFKKYIKDFAPRTMGCR